MCTIGGIGRHIGRQSTDIYIYIYISPKRINNIDPLGGSIVYVCAWEYGCVCAGWEGTGLQAARMNIYHW